MNLSENEINLEKDHLSIVTKELRVQISEMAQELYDKEEKQKEFKKFIWDNKASLDPTEMKSFMSDNDLEIGMLLDKAKHYRLLYKIQNSPYFGSVKFKSDEGTENIYIGLTYLTKENENLIYDWRAPISNLFYDYEIGKAEYKAPMGIIKGDLLNKRQFKIEEGKIKRVFDNSLNIQDDVLQEVLANKSTEKMKNIVNTIQKEQNDIIRNTTNETLIVQGIAGSGKTSVALHRIAFLLYRQENLKSKDILIISPNKVFSEYISNVLPELGEENTKETTFQDFLQAYITEFKEIESFAKFIENYYKYEEGNIDIIKFKQSNEIIKYITDYATRITNETSFTDHIVDKNFYYTKDELNEMLHTRYSNQPLFNRIDIIAEKLSDRHYNGNKTKVKTITNMLYNILNIKKDFVKIYYDFYKSDEFINHYNKSISYSHEKDKIKYEDTCLFVYLKCLLDGFIYNYDIKQTIIDEAQDYNLLQYILIRKILRKSKFTILGDINQTINPYYKYDTLELLERIFKNNFKYMELTKTYRSTPEIIEHTNKILNLSHVSAIRIENNIPVIFKEETSLKEQLTEDINNLRKNSKSIAIITKNDTESKKIHNLLNSTFEDMYLISSESKKFKNTLIVTPSYMSKGLEFDSVIIYTDKNNKYTKEEKYLYYVSCTRCQHQLIIYNQ